MADEATQTDVTNSAAATQTDASAATASNSSTTDQTADAAQADGDADPLDGSSALGDTATGDADAAKDGADGEAGKEGEGDAKDGDAGDKADEPVLIGAPEGDYDLTGVMPEGTAIDADALAKITPTAKALNLSNAGLAKIASEGLPIVQKQVSDGIIAEIVSQRASWDNATTLAISGGKVPSVDDAGNPVLADGKPVMTDAKPDPVFGGKDKDAVLTVAAKALDRFGGDKLYPGAKADGTPGTFRDFLKSTGLGNHPAMVRFAYQAGALISEDTDFERGSGIPNTPKSREDKYYGSN